MEINDTGLLCELCHGLYGDIATHRVFSDIIDLWVCTPCATRVTILPGMGPGRMGVVPLQVPFSPAN